MESEYPQEYLGDGVYASFDGYQIWLKTQEGNEIALDGSVFSALLRYKEVLKKHFEDMKKTD